VGVRASAFGLRVIAWARSPAKHQAAAERIGATLVPIEEAIRDCDYLSLHLPLTDETRGLLDARRLALMKPTAVLINTARGGLVDEAALIELLRNHRIAGAALDVFDSLDVFGLPGPPPRHPLLELDNVLLTPHCAGSSVESSRESKQRGARHAAQVLSGRWPDHVLNPEVSPRQPLTSGGRSSARLSSPKSR
jgi:phosphoglycerate dehydrogenase-like enzyme